MSRKNPGPSEEELVLCEKIRSGELSIEQAFAKLGNGRYMTNHGIAAFLAAERAWQATCRERLEVARAEYVKLPAGSPYNRKAR